VPATSGPGPARQSTLDAVGHRARRWLLRPSHAAAAGPSVGGASVQVGRRATASGSGNQVNSAKGACARSPQADSSLPFVAESPAARHRDRRAVRVDRGNVGPCVGEVVEVVLADRDVCSGCDHASDSTDSESDSEFTPTRRPAALWPPTRTRNQPEVQIPLAVAAGHGLSPALPVPVPVPQPEPEAVPVAVGPPGPLAQALVQSPPPVATAAETPVAAVGHGLSCQWRLGPSPSPPPSRRQLPLMLPVAAMIPGYSESRARADSEPRAESTGRPRRARRVGVTALPVPYSDPSHVQALVTVGPSPSRPASLSASASASDSDSDGLLCFKFRLPLPFECLDTWAVDSDSVPPASSQACH
jgi:hypothetical protein